MSWQAETININVVLGNLEQQLGKLKEQCENILQRIEVCEDIEDLKVYSNILVSLIVDFQEYWLKYTNTYKLAVEVDINNLNNKLSHQIQVNEGLKHRLNELARENKDLLKIIKDQPSDQLINRCCQLLDLIEANVKVLATSIKIRDQRGKSGQESNSFKAWVNTDELINDYKNSGYRITDAMVKKYGMTIQGMRDRLIKAGEYKFRNGGKNNE